MRMRCLKIIGVVCLSVYLLAGCSGADDIRFARGMMTLLIKGRYAVITMIDWPSLRIMERDLGSEYRRLPNAQEKQNYQRAFMEGFRLAFEERRGGEPGGFKDWRLYKAEDANGVSMVSTNTPDKNFALIFFIKHEKGQRRLVEIKMMRVFDQEAFYGKK